MKQTTMTAVLLVALCHGAVAQAPSPWAKLIEEAASAYRRSCVEEVQKNKKIVSLRAVHKVCSCLASASMPSTEEVLRLKDQGTALADRINQNTKLAELFCVWNALGEVSSELEAMQR